MTDFDKKVKRALLDKDKNQKWLIEEVRNNTGLYFDRSYYCKIVNGEIKNPKIINAICEVLEIALEEGA